MFENFTHQQVETDETTINLVRGGNGSPVLTVNGCRQTLPEEYSSRKAKPVRFLA